MNLVNKKCMHCGHRQQRVNADNPYWNCDACGHRQQLEPEPRFDVIAHVQDNGIRGDLAIPHGHVLGRGLTRAEAERLAFRSAKWDRPYFPDSRSRWQDIVIRDSRGQQVGPTIR